MIQLFLVGWWCQMIFFLTGQFTAIHTFIIIPYHRDRFLLLVTMLKPLTEWVHRMVQSRMIANAPSKQIFFLTMPLNWIGLLIKMNEWKIGNKTMLVYYYLLLFIIYRFSKCILSTEGVFLYNFFFLSSFQ